MGNNIYKKKMVVILNTIAIIFFINVVIFIVYDRGFKFTSSSIIRGKRDDKWECVRIANKNEMIKVVWGHYSGRRTEYCKVIFENKEEKSYKLEAPGLRVIIAQVCINKNNISFENVRMDSISK